ncbi:MAG: ribonuclease HII [Bacteroidota bacterium]
MGKVYRLKSFFKADVAEAGCDEAGRGCLAGPVFAAAVILPSGFRDKLLRDSKQMLPENRFKLREKIEKKAIAWAVAMIDNTVIDEINILNASILAMHKALEQLKEAPAHIIVDGNRFKPYRDIPHACVIDGDDKYYSIAAASVLAKTYRDDYMIKLHEEYPDYKWINNKGYATRYHRDMIKKIGITAYHRKSFHLFDPQLAIDFDNETDKKDATDEIC